MSTSLQCHMQFLLYGTHNISEKIGVWIFFSRKFAYPWVQSPLKEELNMILKTGPWELGNLSSFLQLGSGFICFIIYQIYFETDPPRGAMPVWHFNSLFLSRVLALCRVSLRNAQSSSRRPKTIGNQPYSNIDDRTSDDSRVYTRGLLVT